MINKEILIRTNLIHKMYSNVINDENNSVIPFDNTHLRIKLGVCM